VVKATVRVDVWKFTHQATAVDAVVSGAVRR